MKQFFKSVFTHLFALCLFFGGIFVLGLLLIAGIAATGEGQARIKEGSVLEFDLGVNITDAPPSFNPDELFAQIQGVDLPNQISLRSVLLAIDKAAKDERISGIHITGNLVSMNYGSGFAALREIRQALEKFKESGKPVKAYFIYADNKDYYLASVADEIVLHPSGGIGVLGLGSEQVFFKGLFEKYGIGVNVVRAGKYKSFGEPFSRENFSPEEREQLTRMLGGLWSEMVQASAASRGMTPEAFQEAVDSGVALTAQGALKSGFVTRLAKEEEVLGDLAELSGNDREDLNYPSVDLLTYAREARKPAKGSATTSSEVAVIYAEGTIVDGDGNVGEVGADRFVSLIHEIQEDEDVKAVVLRVNSPGGSAVASDRIVDALKGFKEKGIPVVVSMGTVAASGGYYISMAADRILVQPNTITGSIGVIGILPNFQGIAGRHGITTDRVETGKFATLGSAMRNPSAAELGLIQGWIDDFYERFLAVVAEGRKMERDAVHAVAQGRVWTGPDAIEAGLADEIGGLRDAISKAAELADLGDSFRVRDYPRAKLFEDFLEDAMKTSQPAVRALVGSRRLDPVDAAMLEVRSELRKFSQFNDPRSAYMLLPYELTLD